MATVLIAAGGTGGHVFPALAVANVLRNWHIRVEWLGSYSGLEAALVKQHNFSIHLISISGLRGKGLGSWLQAPFKLLFALYQALVLLLQMKPQVVLGVGGYVTGPAGLAAWLLRIPLLIHEQNAIAGLTNRCLAYFATQVMEAFPHTFLASKRALLTGNPVREQLLKLAAPEQRLQHRTGPLRLLVLGGSLGAVAINKFVPQLVTAMNADAEQLTVWHQTGEKNLAATQNFYITHQVNMSSVKLVPFIQDMAEAYDWADIVLCRAGALTVSELAAVGVGAILVPFPFAVDDHQTHNAEFLCRAGAAKLIQQKDLALPQVTQWLRTLIQDRKKIVAMAQAAKTVAIPNAAIKVAQVCKDLMSNSHD